jgi:hypothetical protein
VAQVVIDVFTGRWRVVCHGFGRGVCVCRHQQNSL